MFNAKGEDEDLCVSLAPGCCLASPVLVPTSDLSGARRASGWSMSSARSETIRGEQPDSCKSSVVSAADLLIAVLVFGG